MSSQNNANPEELIDDVMGRKGRVAIIGRPNVGKSTLFNVLTDSRKALVKDQPGVTRDIQFGEAEAWGAVFDVIDTGGLTEADDVFSGMIKEQVLDLLATVDLVLVVMDGRAGICPEDREVIRIAKESGKPILIAVNKVDKDSEMDIATADFYEFGEDVIATSFERRRGFAELLEWIVPRVPKYVERKDDVVTLAIVGKPNVGKSSLCNYLLGERRMLVSDVAGTTTDAIDSLLEHDGKKYILVDTAGLRKSSKRTEDVEVLSAFKTKEAIRRARIVLLLVDGRSGPTDQDSKILQYCLELFKPVIMVANKSDLGKEEVENYRETFREKVSRELHYYKDIHVVFTSATTGYGIRSLFEKIDEVWDKLHIRIPTSQLNDFFFDVIRKAPAPVWGTKNVKLYYLTQTNQLPPSFIAFANFPDGVTPAYRRFLINQIQDRWVLHGIPIRVFIMAKKK